MSELPRYLVDDAALSAELHQTLLYNDEPAFKGIVGRMARILRKSEWSVRDVLRGRVKASLAFLHAACIAADHHPLVRRFLTPRGARMAPVAPPMDPSRPVEEVLTDVSLALADVVRQARRLKSVARRGRRGGQASQAAVELAQGLDSLDMSFQQARSHLAGLMDEEAPHQAA